MVKQLKTKAEFDAELSSAGGKLVAVDFTATWCGPCQRIGPEFVKLANEFTDVVFVKIDVDENEVISFIVCAWFVLHIIYSIMIYQFSDFLVLTGNFSCLQH